MVLLSFFSNRNTPVRPVKKNTITTPTISTRLMVLVLVVVVVVVMVVVVVTGKSSSLPCFLPCLT